MPEQNFRRASRPPPSSLRKAPLPPSTTTTAPTPGLKSKPLIYAICIASIVAAGAVAGAMLKMDREQAAAKVKQQEYREQLLQQEEAVSSSSTSDVKDSAPATASVTEMDYRKPIESLEGRRGQLLLQKMQFERKIAALKESQARQREMEKLKALGKEQGAANPAAAPGEQQVR
ncbi:hypothetical protein LTR84_008909 [Exophiala bonariae]|uniref:Uncharacterized protein n=1 Tax=Exophiala bonariae TaxID=1690606 RepID=A0AAV9MVW1_9EURO|nr:hypothetical protein LTR84_008909 [Exophiala bonariae]